MTEQEPNKPKKRGPKPGGKRGGKPKGYIFPQTLEKREGKEILRQKVLAQLEPIVDALIGKAKGINHFMLRDPENGQWIMVDDPDQIVAALNAPNAEAGSTYWIHVKDPDVAAAKDILDRAIGKPVEEQNVNLTVNTPLADRIKSVRKRLGI